MSTFTVTTTHEHVIPEGWGVGFMVVWEGEDEPGRVSDVDVFVMRIAPDTVTVIGGAPCVRPEGGDERGPWFLVVNFLTEEPDDLYDDTHDFRDRWFTTEQEANEHAEWTEKRWRNPCPWESFVQV
jgi:hypothetical protein